MRSRFSNITKQYGSPQVFLDKLEKLNDKMEACYRGLDSLKEDSLGGRIQKALGMDTDTRIKACKQDWLKLTG